MVDGSTSSLQPMSHTVTIQDLTKAGQEAITTVMGPDQASLQELLTTNPELLAQLAQTAQNAASTNQVSDELVSTIKEVLSRVMLTVPQTTTNDHFDHPYLSLTVVALDIVGMSHVLAF